MVIAWLQSANAAPFFTNDLVGVLKIVGVFGGLAATIGAIFWKVMQAPFRAETKKVAEDLNKVGEKVNATEKTLERHDQRLDQVERDMDRVKGQHEFLMKEMGRLESDIRASIDESREARKERGLEIGVIQRDIASMQAELKLGGRLLGDLVKQRSRDDE